MHFLHLTLLYCMLNVFSSDSALEFPPSSPARILKSITAQPTTTNNVEPRATNIIFQSKDGGQTWQDISQGLPENAEPEGFFSIESDVYLRVKNVMYRCKSNLNPLVWEIENVLYPRSTIAFNRSGVMDWLPTNTNSKEHSIRTIFETSDGAVSLGSDDDGLYKSVDRGQSWKKVQNDGWVLDIVESEGVLIATGQNGIMRSTDNGERWEWVISEGGVGIAVERIDGGFAAISFNTKTLTRRIRISLDSGKTWRTIDEGLQPSSSISSIKQIGKYLICGHPDGIFRSSDMGQTWNIVHSSVDNAFKIYSKTPNIASGNNRKVFTIYVSGNVLYAVARNSGC